MLELIRKTISGDDLNESAKIGFDSPSKHKAAKKKLSTTYQKGRLVEEFSKD